MQNQACVLWHSGLNVRWSLIRGSLKRGTTVLQLLHNNYGFRYAWLDSELDHAELTKVGSALVEKIFSSDADLLIRFRTA